MSLLLVTFRALLFFLAMELPGVGIQGDDVPDPLPTVARASVYVIPGSDGTSLMVWATRLTGINTEVQSTLYVGGTSHDPGHSNWMPTQGVYSGTFESVLRVGQTEPDLTMVISTTTPSGPSILASSDFERRFVPLTATPTTVYSKGGQTQVFIPSGALSTDIYLVLMNTVLAPGRAPTGYRFLNSSYSIRASGANPPSPVPFDLTMSYAPALLGNADPHTVAIMQWSDLEGDWHEIDSLIATGAQRAPIPRLVGIFAVTTGPTWHDSFGENSGIASLVNVTRTENGQLVLVDGAAAGSADSAVITTTGSFSAWGQLRYAGATPPGTALTIDVVAPDGTVLLANQVDGASLSDLSPTLYPILRLRAHLTSQQVGQTPALDRWSVSWQPGAPPPISRRYLPSVLHASAAQPMDSTPFLSDKPSVDDHAVLDGDGRIDSTLPFTATWETAGLVGNHIDALVADPFQINTLFAATGSSMNGLGWGIYRTTDRGTTWQTVYDGLPNHALAADPQHTSVIYGAEEGDVLKSVDRGEHWVELPSDAPTIYALTVDPTQTQNIYACSEWGWLESTDGGAHWTGHFDFFLVTSVAVSPRNSSLLLRGAVDAGILTGITRSTDRGATWTRVLNDDWVNTISFHPTAAGVVFAGTEGRGVFKSTDDGLTWTAANAGLTEDRQIRAFAFHPTYANVVYAGTWQHGVFRSTDSGASWQDFSVGLTVPFVLSLTIDPLSGRTLYAGTRGGGVYRVDLAPPPPPPGSTYATVVDGHDLPVEGANIYRNGALMRNTAGQSLVTDAAGHVILNDLHIGDQLVAMMQIHQQSTVRDHHDGWAYRVYQTSLRIGADSTVSGHTMHAPGEQLLQLTSPLVLFNLIVSLQWNATPAYVQEIAAAMQGASDYLFDATDGQMAFGQVLITDNALYVEDADVQMLASNRVTPYAYVGGLTATDRAMVARLGRQWDGQGGNGAWSAADGFRTIIHEFGHYALGLYDSYLEYLFSGSGTQVGENRETWCTFKDFQLASDATNATLMDTQYLSSELAARDVPGMWVDQCEHTVQWQFNHQSDWETVLTHYADRTQPPRWQFATPWTRGGVLSGPNGLPTSLLAYPVVETAESGLEAPLRTLTVFREDSLPYAWGSLVVLETTRNQRLFNIDQGLTDAQGRITIYGAATGDQLRATSIDGELYASTQIGASDHYELTLTSPIPKAQRTVFNPHTYVIPSSDGRDLLVSVAGMEVGGAVAALVVPPSAIPGQTIELRYNNQIGAYQAVASFPVGSTGLGSTRVRGVGAAGPSEQVAIDNDFVLTQVDTNSPQDLFSPDGGAWLHVNAGTFSATNVFMILMPTGGVPEPLPTGMRVLGSAYSLRASGGLPTLGQPGILHLFYDDARLGNTTPSSLQIARWAGAAGWQNLPTTVDAERHTISATITQLGIYSALAPVNTTPLERRAYVPLLHRQRQ